MSGIFVKDCSCGGQRMKCGITTCLTDAAAAAAAYRHWQQRIADDSHRYWAVHGPSGHVIGLVGTPLPEPYRDLPPPPIPFEHAGRW